MRKRILSILLISIMIFGTTVTAYAETSKDVQQQKEQTEADLEKVNDRIDSIAQQKEAVTEEIQILDTELVDVLTSISICVDEISAKEDQIVVVKQELETAQETAAMQYENMKTRIRFMYEKGDDMYLAIFLEENTLSDMINKATYAEELYSYDRDLLDQYQLSIQQIDEYKTELEIEEADLITCKNELREQQDYLQSIIESKQKTVADFDVQLAAANNQASEYKTKLQEQTAKIKELEAKEEKERQEKAKQEELARNQMLVSSPGGGKSANTAEVKEAAIATINTSEAGSALGREAAAYGCQFIGNPYVYGGTSLTSGTDCSGFTQGVYSHFGIKIPRDSTSQRFCGVGVDYSQAQPGDLICYAGHVALYIGNGQIVHASSERTGIKISNATYRTILAVRRVVK